MVYGILGLAGLQPDGTKPAAHIKVNYEKPSVYAIMGALLESYPALGLTWDNQRYKQAIYILLREVDILTKESVFKVLKEYIHDTETSKRHKYLTGLLLQSCDAMFFLFATTALPPEGFCEKDTFCTLLDVLKEHLNQDERSVYTGSRTWAIQHNAIILGIALALKTYYEDINELGRVFNSWKDHRQQSVLESTGIWRCAVCTPCNRLPKQGQPPSRGEPDEQWMELYQESRREKKDREASAIYLKASTSVQSLS